MVKLENRRGRFRKLILEGKGCLVISKCWNIMEGELGGNDDDMSSPSDSWGPQQWKKAQWISKINKK